MIGCSPRNPSMSLNSSQADTGEDTRWEKGQESFSRKIIHLRAFGIPGTGLTQVSLSFHLHPARRNSEISSRSKTLVESMKEQIAESSDQIAFFLFELFLSRLPKNKKLAIGKFFVPTPLIGQP